jgi:hypothetical protein
MISTVCMFVCESGILPNGYGARDMRRGWRRRGLTCSARGRRACVLRANILELVRDNHNLSA